MQYYFAPMEGVTTYLYRNAHHRYFGGVDKYFMPFFSPTIDQCFSKKELRDVLPENNQGTPVVPQILTKRAEDFIWAAGAFKAMGYTEINLNLGCPSGTVVAKGKGSGFLALPQELEKFLDEIFNKVDIKISIKTRLGRYDVSEFPALLALFHRYPMHEFIVHPRLQTDLYRGSVRLDAFSPAIQYPDVPLCYNGDLRTADNCHALLTRFPQVDALMLGRGLIANPALALQTRGDATITPDVIYSFLDEIYEGYCDIFGSRRNAMLRMKEMFTHMGVLFQGSEKLVKQLRKTDDWVVYSQIVKEIVATCPILAELPSDFIASDKV